MRTKRSHEGYLLVDHRASPGTAHVPEGGAFESATVTCSHCHRVVVINPLRTRDRGYCPKCDHYVCDACEVARVQSGGECNPMNKILDTMQEQAFRSATSSPGGIILP